MNTTPKTALPYFPGCSAMAANRAYDVSSRSVAGVLGLELVELDDWNCCGATAYVALNEKHALVLSARNLALTEKAGGEELVTICNGCYLALRKANEHIVDDAKVQAEVQQALAAGGMSYTGGVRVRHLLDVVVHDLGEEAVRPHVRSPLTGLKVAPYYGCQITRPFSDIDDAEDPQMMDRLVEWLGAEAVPFGMKAKCCGGLMMTTEPEVGRGLSGKILKNARDAGADCVITTCPLCQINLEAYQAEVSEAMGADCEIPVLYFTQLMGVAFGLGSEDLALRDSLTPVEALFAEKVQIP